MQGREWIPMKVGTLLVHGKRFKLFTHFSVKHLSRQSNRCFFPSATGCMFGGMHGEYFLSGSAMFFISNRNFIEISDRHMRVF
jgi:hypothetical protein